MTSNINPNYPEAGFATTQSVRDNFAAAKAEIEEIQFDDSLDQSNVVPIYPGSLVVGVTYKIISLGNTDFTLLGAASNTPKLYFEATSTGTTDPNSGVCIQPGWKATTINIIAEAGPNPPPFTIFRDNIYAHEFQHGNTNGFFVNFQLPLDYVTGSAIYPAIHWSINDEHPNAALGGFVMGVIEFTQARRIDSNNGISTRTFNATQIVPFPIYVPPNSAFQHLVVEQPIPNGFTGLNLEPEAMMLCYIFRDGLAVPGSYPQLGPYDVGDTLDGDAYLFTVSLHYQATFGGSQTRFPPYNQN